MASENNSTLVSHKVDSSVNQQNGNSAPISTLDELMEFSGESDSNPLPPLPASSYSMTVTNGNAAASIAHPHVSNGSIPPSSTTDCINNEPHTSTTIVAEEYDDDPIGFLYSLKKFCYTYSKNR
jgi:hypothetical protein